MYIAWPSDVLLRLLEALLVGLSSDKTKSK